MPVRPHARTGHPRSRAPVTPPDGDDLLQHVAECIARISRHTGGSRERFMASELVQDAVLRNL